MALIIFVSLTMIRRIHVKRLSVLALNNVKKQ
nr:MAG TPA: hypothetical protein [Bacteriophage sp.]